MPSFEFTSPEGKKYTVNGPDGATKEQAFQMLQTQLGSTTQEPKPEGDTLVGEAGRQVGLTARAGVTGVSAIPMMVGDALNSGINMATSGVNKLAGTNIPQLKMPSNALQSVMTDAGVPAPQNATERVVQDVASGMAGTGGLVKAGKFLENAASPITQRVGNMLSAGPGMQTASAATSAGASGMVRENDGGTGAQVLAGLAGAATPSLSLAAGSSAVRGAMRGGEAGRQKVAENIKLFNEASGSTPSVGQASEGRFPRAIESVLSRTPGGAGPMVRDAEAKSEQVANAVRGMADDLSPGASPALAGESIVKGVTGFKEGFKKLQERLYDKLDTHLPAGTPISVKSTQDALKELNADIPGAPTLSEWFKNSKIQGIDAALAADLAKASRPTTQSLITPKANVPATLPYEAIKKLRTLVGRELADSSLMSDVPRSKWTALYAALSDDLGGAAVKSGPKAEEAWRQANTFSRTQLERLEQLQSVVGKDAPEKVFQAAMSGSKEGDTILKRVISAIPKDNRADVAAAVLRRMGNANPSAQNALGDVFSTETFLTNISKISPEAQQTLFGRLKNQETRNQLMNLAKVAANVREGSKVFANPSGTQQAISAQTAGLGVLGALATGHIGAAAAGIGAPIAANALARKMTSPSAVNWLARKTEVSPALMPSEINALSRIYGTSQAD